MLLPVFALDVRLALVAFPSFVSTLLLVIKKNFYFEDFITPFARLWFTITILFMFPELGSNCLKATVLTLNSSVCSLLVLLSVALSHDLTAFFTLVVLSSAPDFVHSDFAYWDRKLASRANFRFFGSCFSHLLFSKPYEVACVRNFRYSPC